MQNASADVNTSPLRAIKNMVRQRTIVIVLTLFIAFPRLAGAQAAPQSTVRSYVIRAAHMIDGRSDVVQDNVAIVVDGTDVGGYAWTENQAQEFAYMVRYGMTPMAGIKSATSVASLADISELTRVSFVMKGGTIYKQ